MDPLLQAFINEYGLFWGALAILGTAFLVRQVFPLIRDRLIPYLGEQRRLKQEREDRLLKAFEDNIRASVEHTQVVQTLVKNQDQLTQLLNAVLVELKVLTAKKPRGNQSQAVGGD